MFCNDENATLVASDLSPIVLIFLDSYISNRSKMFGGSDLTIVRDIKRMGA
jgi:hypothetical protein